MSASEQAEQARQLAAERDAAHAALRRHQGCAAKALAEVPESLPREEQSFTVCESLCGALQFIERDSEEVLAGRVGPSGLLEIERLRARLAALEAQAGAAILAAYTEFRAAALAEEAETGDDEAHRRAWDRYMAAKRALLAAGEE